jgi:acyl-coenzyme A thioesterase PaaI-like protein
MEPDREAELRARCGRAIRDVGHQFVGHDAPDELLVELAETLDHLSSRLTDQPPRTRDFDAYRERWGEELPQGLLPRAYGDRPVSGPASPWGLDLDVHRHGDEIDARLTLRAAHEGAPGRSHGGVVAALFDDVFGFVLGVIGQPAFTGSLSIRYVKATPLHRPLSCRARATGRQGRKIHMAGELVDIEADEVTARATALFIAVDPRIHFASSAERPAPPDED